MELLISAIKNEKFAFYLDNIQEVMEKTDVEDVANAPEFMEGMFNYRNSVIPVFSLRKITEQPSFLDEQLKILEDGRQDIHQWVDSLRDTLENGKEFSKELDPHKCGFGKWIDYNLGCMKCNNHGFVDIVKNKVYNPHYELHSLAKKALGEKNRTLMERISQLKEEVLKGIEILIDNIQLLTNAYQKVIIYSLNGKNFGVTVDHIDRIVDLDKDSIKAPDIITESDVVSAKNIIEYEGKVILVLEFNEKILTMFDSFGKES
ncbi:MAG: chemotaxis protein CheW [Campylobacterales bacterium]|nr:chemotaxis protein CheW [Campylobacterales bacterium]